MAAAGHPTRAHTVSASRWLRGACSMVACALAAAPVNAQQPGYVLESWTVRDGLPVNSISHVVQSRSGYIWLATFDGLVRFDGVRFTVFNTGNSEGLPSNRITLITETRDSSLWLLTDLEQLVRLQRGRFTQIGPAHGLDAPVVGILEGDDGRVWVATHNGGGSIVDGRYVAAAPEAVPAILRGSDRIPVLRQARDAEGRLWHGRGQQITVDGREVYRLPAVFAMTVTTIAVDHEGSIWLGTTAGGLHRLKPAIFAGMSVPEGLHTDNVLTASADRAGVVWVTSMSNRVSRIEGGRARVVTVTPDPAAGFGPVYQDRSGRHWIGTRVCNSRGADCTLPAGAPDIGVRAIYEHPDSTLWFGTESGVRQYRAGQWSRLQEQDGAPRAPVRAMVAGSDGAVWLGTNGGGVVRYSAGAFTHITTARGLPSNLVRALYVDREGWLWVGTEGSGIARIDPRTWNEAGSIVPISTRHGLFDNTVHQILPDDFGRLWFSSNRGIFRVDRADLMAVADGRQARVRSIGYTERHGLRNREANGGSQPAGTRTPDGRLWFATQDGVAVVDPARLGISHVAPRVHIERIHAGGESLAADAGELDIAAGRRDLRFEFTALTFLAPENVRFRYRLDPYDRDWVDGDTRRDAFYTRVPPGRYTFRVIASNDEDVWNEEGAAVELNVTPRFFETRLFAAFLLVLMAALIWGAVRWRLARLRSLAHVLTQRVEERTQELRAREALLAAQNDRLELQAGQLQELDRAKTRFFANVSHELRTPLTLTIGPLEDARSVLSTSGSSVAAAAVPRLDMALRNARRLFLLVNQILDVAKLEAGRMLLRARPGDLTTFARGVASTFEPVAQRRGIAFDVSAPPGQIIVWFDADALEKLLTNLLSNAFKFTPDGGRIVLSVEHDEAARVARLRVTDSGPGIPVDQLAHVFDRFHQVDETNTRTQPGTGIGLSLARELAELHGGTIDVENGAGAGAVFTVTLRIGGSHLHANHLATDATAPHRREAAAPPEYEPDAAPESASREPGVDVTTILVVDDSADLRAYIRARFEPRYRVVEAADGAEGIARARQLVPDLVISDVMMPGTDGLALTDAMRTTPETDFIPVILLTAADAQEQRISGLGKGADDYITKPFDMRVLEARVENLIASRRRLRARFGTEPLRLRPIMAAISSGDTAFLDRLRAAIDANLADPDFGVTELAAAVFQDRSHLFRRVRELLGETPSDLLRRVRLEAAATVLRESEAGVAEVAYGVGFHSVSHFCRTFREAYGVTPSAYRADQVRV